MRSEGKAASRSVNAVVFGAWTLALACLLVTRRYTAFLRPEFGFLLAVALVIAAGFLCATITGNRGEEAGSPGILRPLLLLLPIVYLMVLPDAMLGKHAFNTRFVGPANIAAGRRSPPPQPSAREQTLFDILSNPEMYRGRRVTFTGRILRNEKIRRLFGDTDIVVYRFLINCCAADAQPLAIAVDPAGVPIGVGDQWVRVEGFFELRETGGAPLPIVRKAEIRPADDPTDPYLY